LFGFSGDYLISGAIGSGAERDTAEEVEAIDFYLNGEMIFSIFEPTLYI
jgi:hypothetical protein|tara:strand:- start:1450 stop:1596 length:147 start_codon:yes stop_codon:yes gene_type:complete